MNKSYLLVFACMLFHHFASATIFRPLSIKEQVHDSSAIIQGEVIDISTARDEEYGVLSTVVIRPDYWLGLAPENGLVEAVFPGGRAGDEHVFIEGAPEFKTGERVVVLINQSHQHNWIQNLGLGKFEVKRVGKREVMVNQIFPEIPAVGQMLLNDFIQMAENVKRDKFKRRIKDKYEKGIDSEYSQLMQKSAHDQNLSSRSPASTSLEADHLQKQKRGITATWLALILGFLGALARILAFGKKPQR